MEFLLMSLLGFGMVHTQLCGAVSAPVTYAEVRPPANVTTDTLVVLTIENVGHLAAFWTSLEWYLLAPDDPGDSVMQTQLETALRQDRTRLTLQDAHVIALLGAEPRPVWNVVDFERLATHLPLVDTLLTHAGLTASTYRELRQSFLITLYLERHPDIVHQLPPDTPWIANLQFLRQYAGIGHLLQATTTHWQIL